MALSFPSSPSVGDYYAPGTRVWRWNGTFWEVVTPVQFAKVGNFVETITPTPEGHARLLEGPAVALLVACLLCLSAVSSWAQATVSKVVVDVKMSDGKFQARELTPVANQVIGFDGSGNLVVKAGGSGSGSVTSVAVAGTDGIEVDSGSPITGAGTITLGVNAATMKTTLDLTGTNSGDVTITDTDTIDLGLTGQALTASARTQMSITSDASGLKLSGDAASPGNSKYYGTNSGGTKGYYDLPSGGGSSPTTTQGDIIVRGASVDERLAIGSPNQALRVAAGGTALQYGYGMATRQMFFSSAQLTVQSGNSGSGAAHGMTATYYQTCTTGILSTGGAFARLAPASNRRLAPLSEIGFLDMEGFYMVPTLSNGTETFAVYLLGTTNSTLSSALASNGFCIRISGSTVELISISSSTVAVAAGTTTISAGTWARFRLTYDGTTIRAYKNNVEFANLATGLPAGNSALDLLMAQIIKSAGTTARAVEFRPPAVGIDLTLP